jgi:hypothetical protein
MIELPTANGNVFCELITIKDLPFIFFTTQENIQAGITCVYPVRYYSIETAFNEFLNHTKRIYENR